jgi:hypothetical protein
LTNIGGRGGPGGVSRGKLVLDFILDPTRDLPTNIRQYVGFKPGLRSFLSCFAAFFLLFLLAFFISSSSLFGSLFVVLVGALVPALFVGLYHHLRMQHLFVKLKWPWGKHIFGTISQTVIIVRRDRQAPSFFRDTRASTIQPWEETTLTF